MNDFLIPGNWKEGPPIVVPHGSSLEPVWQCGGCAPEPVEGRHCWAGAWTDGERVGCRLTGLWHRVERTGDVAVQPKPKRGRPSPKSPAAVQGALAL